MSTPRLTAKLRLAQPDAALITATVTMPLADWKRLKAQLDSSPQSPSFPAWKLSAMIRELVSEIEMHFEKTWEPEE